MLLIGFTAVGYLLQQGICHWKTGIFLRLLPGLALLAATVYCWVPLIGIPHWNDLLEFVVAFLLAFNLGSVCLGCLIAWVVYLIGRKKGTDRG